jgi:hypothetical protein
MNSIHSIFQHFHFYQTNPFLFIIMVGIDTCLAQGPHSLPRLQQDTSRTDLGTQLFLKAQPPLTALPISQSTLFHQNNNFLDSTYITHLLAKHPEVREVVLKEYIRLNLSNKTDMNLTQSLSMYLVGNPILENDLKLKIQRYGVPYDPLRLKAWQIGYTFYMNEVISWLKNRLK